MWLLNVTKDAVKIRGLSSWNWNIIETRYRSETSNSAENSRGSPNPNPNLLKIQSHKNSNPALFRHVLHKYWNIVLHKNLFYFFLNSMSSSAINAVSFWIFKNQEIDFFLVILIWLVVDGVCWDTKDSLKDNPIEIKNERKNPTLMSQTRSPHHIISTCESEYRTGKNKLT